MILSKPANDAASLPARVVERLRSVVGSGAETVPLHEPEFAGSEWTLVKDCLDSGWVSAVGEYVDRFELRLAQQCGTAHAVAVVNGTAALHVAMIVSGVQPGDEVIVPALTFVATANAVSHTGAVPHFADSASDTLGICPAALHARLTRIAESRNGLTFNRQTGRRLSAIVPMHALGHPADMDGILEIADEFALAVVEDAAEALGSLYKGKPCGSLGRVGVLSFNGNKIVTTGGGGAIVTNDADLAEHAKHLATTAKVPHSWAFLHDEIGYNYRLPNINAAMGCAQLEQLEGFLSRKRRLAQRYIEAFSTLPGLEAVREPSFATSNYWLNAIILEPGRSGERDAILKATNANGLKCRPLWTPMHRLPMYANCPRAPLPVVEELETRVINIPSSARWG